MTFGEYQELAHSFSGLSEFKNPLVSAGKSTFEEAAEITYEGINVARFPMFYGFESGDDTEQAAVEFGNILWFINEDLVQKDRSLSSLAKDSLLRNANIATGIVDVPISRFDKVALQKASHYTVVNHQMLSRLPSNLKESANIKLQDSPGFVLQRVLGRLIRTLYPPYDNDERFRRHPDITELDSRRVIEQSRGDALWVISWIGQTMLDASLDEIAQMNIQNLIRRAPHGILLTGDDTDNL